MRGAAHQLTNCTPAGLFFLDGEEWWATRRKLNPLFLKQQSLCRLHSIVETRTEDLIRQGENGLMSILYIIEYFSKSGIGTLGTT